MRSGRATPSWEAFGRLSRALPEVLSTAEELLAWSVAAEGPRPFGELPDLLQALTAPKSRGMRDGRVGPDSGQQCEQFPGENAIP